MMSPNIKPRTMAAIRPAKTIMNNADDSLINYIALNAFAYVL